MKTAVLYLTENGRITAEKIGSQLDCCIYNKHDFTEGIKKFTAAIFNEYQNLIFIMATGIVVRIISDLIKDKTNDPAVIVMDEKGRFAISLLSGHIGGANKLAEKIAYITGGIPVITTATDINNVIAFDMFAKENNCVIENIDKLKYVSSDIVNGKNIGMFSDYEMEELPAYLSKGKWLESNVIISNKKDFEQEIKGNSLLLTPKNLVLGIGCRKGITVEDIENAVIHFLNNNNKKLSAVKCLASIDIKKEEKGILDFCNRYQLDFITISRKKLEEVESEFSCSDFVKQAVGAGSVSEACAAYAFDNTQIICKKTIYKGITLALGEIIYMYRFV